MHLIIALGNIGKEYEQTRHNYGFLGLDKIISDYSLSNKGVKFKSEIFSGEIAGNKVVAIKPQTLMNLSGIAASQVKSFYKTPITKIIVLHDDLDLALGKVKVKVGGGDGGHNGLKSLDQMIGKNYLRLRLGIGRPQHEGDVSNYVLGNFNHDESNIVDDVLFKISKNFPSLLSDRSDEFLNKFHLK